MLTNLSIFSQQSCFRAYRESVRYLMISFAVTRAQACMRGRLARSRLALEVAAATNIVSIIFAHVCPFKLL
jgi:hypothetical protein